MPPIIKIREDVDGCGCLECQNIETSTTHRTVLDTLVWSGRKFRSYPSIIAFTAVIILSNRMFETVSINEPTIPVIGTFEALAAFALIFLMRAYVGIVVAGELVGEQVTIREGLHRCIARIPTLVGVVLLVGVFIMTIPSLLSLPLIVLVGVFPGNPVELVGFPVAAAIFWFIFSGPLLILLFKFWFVPEACVIGKYGPIESLRVSWRITTDYRRKFVLVILIGIGSAIGLQLPASPPEIVTSQATFDAVLNVIFSSASELLSVVWAGAYAHIYIQEILSDAPAQG